MKGSAPKDPETGSQSCWNRKRITPAASAGRDTCTSSSTTTPTTSRTAPPKAPSRAAQRRSPACAPDGRRRGGAAIAAPSAVMSTGCGKLDRPPLHGHRADRLLHLGHDRLRERRIVERGGSGLAFVDGPPQEVEERLALRLVGLVAVGE